jgi:hypothetical protein
MVDIQATVGVTGGCNNGCPNPTVTLVSVKNSELDDANGGGDGQTTGDILNASPGSADFAFNLRAERTGNGPGRTYEVVYQVIDCQGNSSLGRATVLVPHDQATITDPLQLQLEPGDSPDGAHISWGAVAGAEGYDLVSGNLANLTRDGQRIVAGTVRVLATGPSLSFDEGQGGARPAPGEVFFYLGQYRAGQQKSGWGTASAPLPRILLDCEGGCP